MSAISSTNRFTKRCPVWRMGPLAFLACLFVGGPTHARELENPAEAFGRREAVGSIALSPSGNRVVYLAPGPGEQTRVDVFDVATSRSNLVVSSDGDPMELDWCRFVNDQRLVCLISALVEPGRQIIPVTRIFAINTDGSDGLTLGQRESMFRRYRQFDGSIIDWLTEDEDWILMSRYQAAERQRVGSHRRSDEKLGVVRVNTVDGQAERVEQPGQHNREFLSDGNGTVRMKATMTMRGGSRMLGDTLNYHYRRLGSNDWHEFGTYNLVNGTGFNPLVVDHDLNAVYGLQNHNDRKALYRVTLNETLDRELVYAHPGFDVSRLVRLGRSQRVIGVGYSDDENVVEYFDPEYEALHQALSNALGGNQEIVFLDSSDDESRLLILATSATEPGRYYVFDKTELSLVEILLTRPTLENVPLAEVRPVRYPARDGTLIPAYLTLPPGGDTENLPAIVLPHGGPQSRTTLRFDWLAQFFAHQGYAVLQPNFRGSSGYGTEWLVENGFRNWETAISDVNDGGHWLVSEGIANADQMAAVGWSYGGYAALQSGVLEPGLFKAIVAIAPVTDLRLLREDAMAFTSGRNVAEYLGSGPHLTAGSPARHADRITVPVLLFHGDQDINVDVGQSRLMHDRIGDAGGSSELVIFEDLDHGLRDSAVRAQMLERSDAFLREALGL